MRVSDEAAFAAAVLDWFDRHGRKDLPWKSPVDPYRIWVSEIMLQQTRVQTVLGYFQRFMQRFPDVNALADAPLDDVLGMWSGLGYYARCRNLHAAACAIRDEYQGQFPQDMDALQALPGIGRSTAAAILAQAFGQRQAILDGNVKRVLARHGLVEGWPGNSKVQQALWQIAEQHTPDERIADYTQAMMDLGAMVCVRSKPLCDICPVQTSCQAHAQGRTKDLPAPKPKKTIPQRHKTWAVVYDSKGRVLLERRPEQGIWGGLWTFPEMEAEEEVSEWCAGRLGAVSSSTQSLDEITHVFSHFKLHAKPCLLHLEQPCDSVREGDRMHWYVLDAPLPGGVPAPVERLLKQLPPLNGGDT